eukprot:TRINITY_DN13092_c0_g1_i1.p1 TRINITY_DN13092_c0_g1~~TRINITY_DN13092_c0_g1_i1.p1  ORF type:complete len:225 (-),score=16.93 TRINITY_DN13092_c0_g1_i1:625-1299(-)
MKTPAKTYFPGQQLARRGQDAGHGCCHADCDTDMPTDTDADEFSDSHQSSDRSCTSRGSRLRGPRQLAEKQSWANTPERREQGPVWLTRSGDGRLQVAQRPQQACRNDTWACVSAEKAYDRESDLRQERLIPKRPPGVFVTVPKRPPGVFLPPPRAPPSSPAAGGGGVPSVAGGGAFSAKGRPFTRLPPVACVLGPATAAFELSCLLLRALPRERGDTSFEEHL